MFAERIQCCCGSNVSRRSWPGHRESKKHLAYKEKVKMTRKAKNKRLAERGLCIICEKSSETLRCPECEKLFSQMIRVYPEYYQNFLYL